ncbi:alpha/beta fold hydrolase [Streptomyces sp. NPDC053069]|uniref:alpha/beta fold hydrolase n=1 Tax=Streptomyces sp. NPDC053069 TaxID=3365695 RepID=UPI0037D4C462
MMIDFVPDESLYPFESRWFDSSVGRLHYIDEGSGPALLFCHGSPTWSFLYRHIVKGLRDRYRCIAVDYLGFGLSERPRDFGYTIAEHTMVLGELIDHLQLDGFILMGQDWGGPIGLGAASTRAARVRGLVLGNTVFWPIERLANRAFSAIMSSRPMQRRILERNLLVEQFLLGKLGPTYRGRGRPLPHGATHERSATWSRGHAQRDPRRAPPAGTTRPGRACPPR